MHLLLQPTQLLELALGDLECEREKYKQKQKYIKKCLTTKETISQRKTTKREKGVRDLYQEGKNTFSHDEEIVRSRWNKDR